jgi:hypothetical protein
MERLRDLFDEAIEARELVPGNVAGNFLSFIFRKEIGGHIQKIVRADGNFDLALLDEEGEEIQGFWFEYFKIVESLYGKTKNSLEKCCNIAVKMNPVMENVMCMGFTLQESALIMAMDVALVFSSEFRMDSSFEDKDYLDFLLELRENL